MPAEKAVSPLGVVVIAMTKNATAFIAHRIKNMMKNLLLPIAFSISNPNGRIRSRLNSKCPTVASVESSGEPCRKIPEQICHGWLIGYEYAIDSHV